MMLSSPAARTPMYLLIAMTHASTLLKTSHSPSEAMMSRMSLLRRISSVTSGSAMTYGRSL